MLQFNRQSKRGLLVFLALLMVFIIPVSILTPATPARAAFDCAINDNEASSQLEAFRDFASFNDVRWFDPCETACAPTSSVITNAALTDESMKVNLEIILRFYTGQGMSLKQAAAIAGNYQQESGFDPKILNSIGAYGIAQWLGGRKTNLMNKPNHDTIEVQLEFSMEELRGSESKAFSKFLGAGANISVSDLAVVFGEAYERYGSNEEGNRRQYAESIYSEYLGVIQDGSGISLDEGAAITVMNPDNSGCVKSASTGSVSGSIVQTAINLSWSDNSHSASDAKPEYAEAMKKISLEGKGCRPQGADCGVFVATVMRSSGADTGFPVGTSEILSYLQGNMKYEKIPNLGNTSNLEPGDIFIIRGHTMIYVGDGASDGGKNMAAASCSDHTAQRGSSIFFRDGRGTYEIYRFKPGIIA